MIVHFFIRRKLDIIDTIRNFSVLLRTGSDPPDINWFQSHTGKISISKFFYVCTLYQATQYSVYV